METVYAPVSGGDWAWATTLCVVVLFATFANGLALIVFSARPSLRTLANRFVINLLAGNLACALLLGSLLVINQVQWMSSGQVSCAVAEGAAAFFSLAAVLAVFLITTDQYLAVTDPLRYHAKVSCAKSLLMIGAQWVISGVFGIAAALTPQPTVSVWNFCEPVQQTERSSSFIYKKIFSSIFIGCVLVLLMAVCLMYYQISMAAHRSAKPPAPSPPLVSLKIDPIVKDVKAGEECVSLLVNCDKKTLENNGCDCEKPTVFEPLPLYELRLAPSLKSVLIDVNKPYPSPLCLKFTHEMEKKRLSHDDIYKISQPPPSTGLKTVRSSPNFGSGDCQINTPPPRCSSSYMSSLRYRISNASLFRYGEESRAARISVLVVILAFVSQLPPAVMQIVPALGIVPLALLSIGGCVSPFLFAYRSRRVQKELFSLCKRANSVDYSHNVAPLRRASSLSTERSWHSTRMNSSQTALRLLKALAAESETKTKTQPVFSTCPPGKSILKRVRARSLRWGRRANRCKFSCDHSQKCNVRSLSEPRTSSSSAASSNTVSDSS